MSFTLTTSGACILKGGKNANSETSGAMLATFCDLAEGFVCTATRKDWITDYSSVKTNFKPILSDVVSDVVGMKIISYDMSGYTSRIEAQGMLDVLRDNVERNITLLKDDAVKEKM